MAGPEDNGQPPVRYFMLDPRGLTVGECWRLAHGLDAFFTLLFSKWGLTHWRPPLAMACAVEWPAIDPADIPPAVGARLDEPITLLEARGFRAAAHGSVPQLDPDFQHNYLVLLLSEERETGAAVIDARAGAMYRTSVNLTTRFTDGTFGITSNALHQLAPPPDRLYSHHPGLPADALYDRHLRNLGRWEAAGKLVDRFGPDEAVPVSRQLTVELFEHLADRGAVAELTPQEIDRRRRAAARRARTRDPE